MRLFFAYWPSASKAEEMLPWVHQAHALYGGRMMRTDTLHMTLAFLGQADASQVQQLVSACAQWQLPSGSMLLSEPGHFPGAKVVWVGPSVAGPASLDWLYEANQRLWEYLRHEGWQRRDTRYRPHVSLLRNASPGDLSALKGPPVEWAPGRCVLVGSQPTDSGSRYTLLAEIPLLPEAP